MREATSGRARRDGDRPDRLPTKGEIIPFPEEHRCHFLWMSYLVYVGFLRQINGLSGFLLKKPDRWRDENVSRLLVVCPVVKANHPCLECLGFYQFQLRLVLDVLKEWDSTT
jgi:hypothetical protein